MAKHWKCPQCGRLHEKFVGEGTVIGNMAPYQAQPSYRRDEECACGKSVSGAEIAGGKYDDSSIENAAFLPVAGALAGGIAALLIGYDFRTIPFWIALLLCGGAGFVVHWRMRSRLSR